MALSGPIIVLEDDLDDQEVLKEVIQELKIINEIKFFTSSVEVLNYLLVTTDKPLIIISDVNIPIVTGTELKKKINENEYLRKKSIPFIFLSTNSHPRAIDEAYDLMVQGYFVKPGAITEIKNLVSMIINYWKVCKHPNSQ
jgi:CheY-like chemotaxis protein